MVETTMEVADGQVQRKETTEKVRRFIVNLLGVLGNLAANWFVLEKWQGDASVGVYIGQVLAALVINLGTLVFMGLWSMLSRFEGLLEVVGEVILAVEAQSMGYDTNEEKLDQAVKLINEKLGKNTKLSWLSRMAIKPLARVLISSAARPLKVLIYKEPPIKLKVQ